jgi:beta-phosphoglucomutase-like phosphatase (HAD superfamily)
MPPHPLYDAVVFDLDGTLIDTETLCNAAGVAACAEMGMPVDLAFFESLAGIHDEDRVRLISAHIGRAVPQLPFFANWDRHVAVRMQDGILKPGATDLLARIAVLGMPMALATSSRGEPARAKLARAGLARWFPVVITFDDVTRGKPAPDPYLLACARLGVTPSRALAFEDSEPGATAAHVAGLTVVQVPDIHPTDGRHAHFVAATLLVGAKAAGLI